MSLDLEPLEGAFRTRLDEPEWTTVWAGSTPEGLSSHVAPLPLADGVEVPAHDFGAAHSTKDYADTGREIDSSTSATIEAWRRQNAQFFTSDGSVGSAQHYQISPGK